MSATPTFETVQIISNWPTPSWALSTDSSEEAVQYSRDLGSVVSAEFSEAVSVYLTQRDDLHIDAERVSVTRTPVWVCVAGVYFNPAEVRSLRELLDSALEVLTKADADSGSAGRVA
jgi:hypothetical protein